MCYTLNLVSLLPAVVLRRDSCEICLLCFFSLANFCSHNTVSKEGLGKKGKEVEEETEGQEDEDLMESDDDPEDESVE